MPEMLSDILYGGHTFRDHLRELHQFFRNTPAMLAALVQKNKNRNKVLSSEQRPTHPLYHIALCGCALSTLDVLPNIINAVKGVSKPGAVRVKTALGQIRHVNMSHFLLKILLTGIISGPQTLLQEPGEPAH